MIKVVFAGGGTGGHIFPAVAIAERLMGNGRADHGVDVVFVGTKNKIESRVIPHLGYKFRSIWIGGFSRKFKLSNLLLPLKIAVAVFQSLKLLLTFRPDVVVGTGGYVSGPVCAAALMTRIPILLQEHNSYPGAMTRMFAPFAREIHIAFETSKKYFGNRANLFVTGSPVRKMPRTGRIEALNFFGLGAGRQTILITGGSLGAAKLNSAILDVIDDLTARNCQLIWQTGSVDFDRIRQRCEIHPDKRQLVKIVKFIERMDLAYSAADIAICRGGATTIAELIYFSLPAVIVPYPYATANHQVENARSLVEKGAVIMVQEHEVASKFKPELLSILNHPPRLAAMKKKIGEMSHDDAAEVIAKSVLKIAGAHE